VTIEWVNLQGRVSQIDDPGAVSQKKGHFVDFGQPKKSN
jgi:hypothetical protein